MFCRMALIRRRIFGTCKYKSILVRPGLIKNLVPQNRMNFTDSSLQTVVTNDNGCSYQQSSKFVFCFIKENEQRKVDRSCERA